VTTVTGALDRLRAAKSRPGDYELLLKAVVGTPATAGSNVIWSFDDNEQTQFLSNFAKLDTPMMCYGVVAWTVEHLYQSLKTTNEMEAKIVLSAATPGRAKHLGQRVTLRPDWAKVKNGFMLNLLSQKFDQPRFRDLLLATGERFLVEGNTWHDLHWGVCFCKTHNGQGRNWLGHQLMVVRDNIREELSK
jgi:ribA/ribD-fused uncharacterized protein